VFIRQIGRMGYELQADLYTRGVRDHIVQSTDRDPVFVFLAQEITAPFACSLIGMSQAYQEIGRVKVERAIRLWGQCMRTQNWPLYSPRIHYAEPTPWELSAIETGDAV
jgi:exodeoxyribonuclease VIII